VQAAFAGAANPRVVGYAALRSAGGFASVRAK
jgi:hypothetical protein